MTEMFETVARILRANTSDLQKLADIAGVDPRTMYLGADLTGADLRDQDVQFLKGLKTNHAKAHLTTEQREMLQDDSTDERQYRLRKVADSSIRHTIISKFIDEMAPILSEQHKGPVSEIKENLSAALLLPVAERNTDLRDSPFPSAYINSSLRSFSRRTYLGSEKFSVELFRLFGETRCPPSRSTPAVFDETLAEIYSVDQQVNLIACGQFSSYFIMPWIYRGERNRELQKRALAVAKLARLSGKDLEQLLNDFDSTAKKVDLVRESGVKLDRDASERLAYLVLSSLAVDEEVSLALSTSAPEFQRALLRQVLVGRNANRVKLALRWLDRHSGEVGGLAVSDAIVATGQFPQALGIAKNVVELLGSAQREAMFAALDAVATADSEKRTVANLRRRHPPSSR